MNIFKKSSHNSPKWEQFKISKLNHLFSSCKFVLDIGGGLRIDKSKNNRFDTENYKNFYDLSKSVDYKIMDPVPDYNPDLVGDIHKMPLQDGEVDAIICIAVLEHVEDPIRAVEECYRVLKPGGQAFFYQPFLFYYHAEVGYYKDYWRFSEDANRHMFRNFKHFEICPVMGRFGTIGRLISPKYLQPIGKILDLIFVKNSKQVSGYYVYVQK